jgi:hypothetical protein
MFGDDVYRLITSQASIQAVVGARVYPEQAQQDAALPRLVYRLGESEPVLYADGSVSHTLQPLEIVCQALSVREAESVADVVKDALSGFDGTVGGTEFQAVLFAGAGEDREQLPVPADEGTYLSTVRFTLIW